MWGLWLVSGNGGMVVVSGGSVVFAFAWVKRDREIDAGF